MDAMVMWAVVANVIIALDYVAIGAFVSPKFDAASSSVGLRAAKAAALVFFVTCGLTHLDVAFHAWLGEPWMRDPHFLVVHTIQAIAAPVFLYFANRFTSIGIWNKTLYDDALRRRVHQVREELARERQQGANPATTGGNTVAVREESANGE